MEKHKVCSFFGHRKITVTEELKRKIKEVIEELVAKQNVLTFLFGFYQSKSGTALAYAYAKRKKKVLINVLQ